MRMTFISLSIAPLYAFDTAVMSENELWKNHLEQPYVASADEITTPYDAPAEEASLEHIDAPTIHKNTDSVQDTALTELIEAAIQENAKLEAQIAEIQKHQAEWENIYDISFKLELNASLLQQLQDEQEAAIATLKKYTQQ